MKRTYQYLSHMDRATLMLMRDPGPQVCEPLARNFAEFPTRSAGSCGDITSEGRSYDADQAAERARTARILCCPRCKLIEGTDLYAIVLDMLRNRVVLKK
nr:hypothetical protein [Nitrosococcus oceani]